MTAQKNPRRRPHTPLLLLVLLTGLSLSILPITLTRADAPTGWRATLHITETSGAGNTVIFGKTANASDGQDVYDQPEPPAPPIAPFIRSWFKTTFAVPFNNLLQEYKNATTEQSVWNLSILWVPLAENATTTTVTLQWNPTDFQNTLQSCQLSQNNTIVDMLTTDTYSFQADTTVQTLQIQAQNKADTNGEPNGSNSQTTAQSLLTSPLAIGIILLVVIIIALAAILILRKKK